MGSSHMGESESSSAHTTNDPELLLVGEWKIIATAAINKLGKKVVHLKRRWTILYFKS